MLIILEFIKQYIYQISNTSFKPKLKPFIASYHQYNYLMFNIDDISLKIITFSLLICFKFTKKHITMQSQIKRP